MVTNCRQGRVFGLGGRSAKFRRSADDAVAHTAGLDRMWCMRIGMRMVTWHPVGIED